MRCGWVPAGVHICKGVCACVRSCMCVRLYVHVCMCLCTHVHVWCMCVFPSGGIAVALRGKRQKIYWRTRRWTVPFLSGRVRVHQETSPSLSSKDGGGRGRGVECLELLYCATVSVWNHGLACGHNEVSLTIVVQWTVRSTFVLWIHTQSVISSLFVCVHT